ncbi:MAG: SPFH domain-containing protein [Anaerolineae bacterium]
MKDSRQVPYRVFGGLVWGAVVVVAFLFGFLYYAQFVLPLRGSEGWTEGFQLLARYYYTQAQQYLKKFASRPDPKAKKRKAKNRQAQDPSLEQLPASFKKLRAGIVRSHEVLAISKDSTFSRPAGPGFVTLFKGEQITQLVDLRNQTRRQPVHALTRDGIEVDTTVSVTFRVRQAPQQTDPHLPFPYDKDAIFQVSRASRIGEAKTFLPWTERLCPQAASMLITHLARFRLDEFFQVDDEDIPPLREIRDRIREQLQHPVTGDGIEILGVGVGQLTLSDKVNQQRVVSWQAEWKRRIMENEANSDADEVRRLKTARARAQIEIIENITQSIAAMRRMDDADLTEMITLRMIEALEEAMSDASVQALIPQQVMTSLVMDASSQLQAWVEPGPEEP